MPFHQLKDVTSVTVRGITLCVDTSNINVEKKTDDITTNCDEGATRTVMTEKKLSGTLGGPWDSDQNILDTLNNIDDTVDEPVVITLGNGRVVTMPDCLLQGGIAVQKGSSSRFTINFESQGTYTIT